MMVERDNLGRFISNDKMVLSKRKLVRLYNETETGKIAEIFGVSKNIILKNLRKYGIKLKRRGAPKQLPNYWIVALKKKKSVCSHLKGKTKETNEILKKISNSTKGEKSYNWKPELHIGEMIKCECGCGQLISKRDKRGRLRYYKKGHDPKGHFQLKAIPWNKGTLYGKNISLLLKIKQSVIYKEWRLAVYKKDKYSCQICANRKKIVAHHIIPMKQLYKDFLMKYINLDEKQLYNESKKHIPFWDISNGMTLCQGCHKLIHSREGKKIK